MDVGLFYLREGFLMRKTAREEENWMFGEKFTLLALRRCVHCCTNNESFFFLLFIELMYGNILINNREIKYLLRTIKVYYHIENLEKNGHVKRTFGSEIMTKQSI